MKAVLILLLSFSWAIECKVSKERKQALQLAKIYEKMNADPNLQTNSIRIDHKVVPKAIILKLKEYKP